MNRKIKTISAAMLAAAICASFAGCANKEKPNNGGEELTESNIESHLESLFGGGESSTPSETSQPEEYKPEMTDEIKKAALNSGLVQLNNDVFQRGGYMTAADFVKKYKDSYDITYYCPGNMGKASGTYDECKDYLLEYCDTFFEGYDYLGRRWKERKSGPANMNAYDGTLYSLKLTPKEGKGGSPVEAFVVNATSPDEKITLDKAIVAEVSPNFFNYEFTTPEWIPMGLNTYEFDEYESENKNYTAKNIGETLEAKGLKKNSEFEQSSMWCPSSRKPENFNTYWKSGDEEFGCYVLGEENLFGAKPLYYCSFVMDPNTDKLKYASCTLEYFVKE